MLSINSFPHARRALFIFTTVCLLTSFAASVFVAARSDSGETPQQPSRQTPVDPSRQANIAKRFGRLPLSFEINQGQVDQSVKFLSHGPGYDLFLTGTEAVVSLRKPRPSEKEARASEEELRQPGALAAEVREGSILRLKMLGANAGARVEGQDDLPGKVNYFIGNDPDKWRSNIPTYRRVYYKDVYAGIDIVYYGNQRELEYDFVIAPGADPRAIKFRIDGADRIRLDESGNLLLALKHGEVRLNKPFIYQTTDKGARNEVKGAYAINGNEVSFKVRGFDSRKPLVIDPVLSYSTFLGSSSQEQAFGIAVDSQGSAYVTGVTSFSQFPTTAGAFQATSQSGGAFVTKLDPTGSSLVYSTYLSGRNGSTGNSIAVDSAGNAYVTGDTSSIDFPIVNGLKTGSNFFKTTDSAANWTNTNSGLLPESVRAIAVAPNAPNTIYAALTGGPYRSTDGGATWTKTPTTGLSASFAQTMAVDPTNSSVVYVGPITGGLWRSTNGGNNWSTVNVPLNSAGVFGIAFDPVTPSTVYLASGAGVFKSTDSGNTWSALNNFGLPNAPNVRALAIDPTTPSTMYAGTTNTGANGLFKTTNGGASWTLMNTGMVNAFTVNTIVIDPFDSQTVYAGSGFQGSSNSAINKTTNGGTSWTQLTNGVPNFPVTALVADRSNASTVYASTLGSGVVKTSNGGTSWTTANAGVWRSDVHTLVAHPSNSSILFAGGGGDFFFDAFVTKLNPSGSGLLFSTFLGGMFGETGHGITVDSSGNIYVVGITGSPNFPAVNALQSAQVVVPGGSNCNSGFVSKIDPAGPSFVFSTYLDGNGCDTARAVALDSGANVYITGSTGSTDFPIANAFQSTKSGFFGSDAFVTKLTTGGSLVYSTYLGGAGEEHGFGIAVDASGNAHVAGLTESGNFPTLNPIQAVNGGGPGDAFVTKLNSGGSGLIYSTFLGGTQVDTARGIALDSAGNAYVAGFAHSAEFPLVAGSLATKSGLYKSLDGAANWTNDNYGLNVPVMDLAIHPTQPSTIFAGTDAGAFKSTNGGKTWTPINGGLLCPFVRAIAIDPLNPSTMYAGTIGEFAGNPNNGVYKTTDGGNNWDIKKTGLTTDDVHSLAINPATPTILYAAGGGRVFKSTDGADNWAPSGTGGSLSTSCVAVDPHAPTTVFACESFSNGGIWRSTDSGATWQKITSNSHDGVFISPLTPGLIYATGSGSLFKSVDNGNNWVQVRTGIGLAKVVFDPVSSSTVYVASGVEGVLKSTDNGQTWVQMNKGIRSPIATKIAIDPVKPSTLYLASSTLGSQSDAFVTKINPTGSTLIYSTLIAGQAQPSDALSLGEFAFAIAVDSTGSAYVAGSSRTQIPTSVNSYQPINRGGEDAFIAKLVMSHIINGRVKEGNNAPVTGAEVVLNDGTSIQSVISESDGSYEFSHLREGGNYTVSATKPHFTMSPTSQTFNNLNNSQTLDFTATATNAAFHTISGQITNNGVGLANVTVTLSGSQPGLRTTDSNGNYSFELAAGGNYTVTPSILGFTFAPLNQTFNNLSAPQTANFAGTRQNFVVTNANNHGTGSLREAITNANATVGVDTIVFNIPGSGVKLIKLLNALPDITDAVVIDGTTQPGYAGLPLIELDGTLLGSNGSGIVIKAGGSTVRGLALGGFGNLGIWLSSSDNNLIQGNHIGLDATGTAARPNSTGMRLSNSSNNIIGGTTAAARNVISGNRFDGVEIGGNGNVVQGNYIGTNAAGTAAIPNDISGVSIPSTQFSNNVIGGTAPGAGNLISGNQTGINTQGTATTIQGNLIGTDPTGTQKVGNVGGGIIARGPNTQIGGLTPAARNIISGNGTGVHSEGAGSKIEGNFIGTDITGTSPLGNIAMGVTATNTLIGGTTPEARNIISANGNSFGGFGNVALGFNTFGPGATVQGNYIGTDVTGTKMFPNTDEGIQSGITVFSNNHVIGGTDAGAGNVISGNDLGIRLGGLSSPPSGVVVQGNIIGLNAQGTAPLPNFLLGISVAGDNNIIGGIQNGAANKIAFNGLAGVEVNTGAGNSIRGNSIFSNGGLGIDLDFTSGVTPNDLGDLDFGANNLQNFPVVMSVFSNGGNTTIQGTLNSTPNTTFQIDFYSNAAVDGSGHGEGALFFNTTPVTTDASGNATFNVTFPMALPTGRTITATATSPSGSTSEFSAADVMSATGSLQFSSASFFVIEDIGQMVVTVQRVGGFNGSLSVEYETVDGTAIAGQDYTATSGTLNFADGETTKSFLVPITEDVPTEADENFTVRLKNPSNLEAFGVPINMAVTIQDKTTVPFLFVLTNPAVLEGDSGTTRDALFEVRLSAATGRTVSVDFATANVNAHGGAACGAPGVDYESRSGNLTFRAINSITVKVEICGDSSAEANEQFGFVLTKPVNATIAIGDALGQIVNDDVMQLLLEESGPGVNQVAAVDSLLFVRDPFRVVTVPELFANGTDRNTRVALFVRNLELNPGETSAAVVVRLIGSNNQIFDVPAEDFRAVPGFDFMQVTFRLPNTIPAGTAALAIRAHGRVSNIATLRIAP